MSTSHFDLALVEYDEVLMPTCLQYSYCNPSLKINRPTAGLGGTLGGTRGAGTGAFFSSAAGTTVTSSAAVADAAGVAVDSEEARDDDEGCCSRGKCAEAAAA